MQGQRKQDGERVGAEEGDGTYRLKIHEHTQKLDNDTTKLGKGTVKSFKEIKEAQF